MGFIDFMIGASPKKKPTREGKHSQKTEKVDHSPKARKQRAILKENAELRKRLEERGE